MKRLAAPAMNDGQVLAQLAADSQRDLRNYLVEIPRIQQQYQRYIAAAGNASCRADRDNAGVRVSAAIF